MAWSKQTRISIMLGIDIVFFLVELISGFVVHSLALTADAFHMLNDIISLLVGLWAVSVASKATTDKYSYGWLRAEILGAFFNAVFLIALCVSIILEAVTRFLDPPVVDNPILILIVGAFGLTSNLVGFWVLGGHGHSHGPGGDHDHDHDHDHGHAHNHDELSAAEEGVLDDGRPPIDVLPHMVVERERRRANSSKHNRLTSIDDLSIHPSSFRQNIIDHSRSNDDFDESSADEEAVTTEPAADENTPLINGKTNGKHSSHGATDQAPRRWRSGSITHKEHHHSKPKSATRKSGGHGHNHDDMGMNGMILHVLGDALGNVGVIVTALVIWLTDWPGKYYADPAVSLFITLIILRSALPLTFASSKILLQATPDHIDLQEIKEDIQALPGVISCHHVHIWQLSDTKIVASMHVQVAFPITEEGGEKYMALAKQARKCLHAYGIHSATIQPEFCLDESCERDHIIDAGLVLDGEAAVPPPARCGGGGHECLLECVDNCVGQGCCTVTSQAGGSSRKSSHSAQGGHNHEHEHDHDHDHAHDGHQH